MQRLDETLAAESPHFEDRLIFTLELRIPRRRQPIVINGHNILHFSIDLQTSGFSGEVCFKIDDDSELKGQEKDLLWRLFRQPKLLLIKLGIAPEHRDRQVKPGAASPPFEINALSTEKSLIERTARHTTGSPLSYRVYQIRFADPAQVLWRQHFPCALYANSSLKAMILRNRTRYITMRILDPTMARPEPFLFVGLRENNRPSERASFYDLLMWQLAARNRIFTYDYARKSYVITRLKQPPKPINVVAENVAEIFTYYPPPPLHARYLMNDYTGGPQRRKILPRSLVLRQGQLPRLRQDTIFNTPIRRQFEAKYRRMMRELRPKEPEHVLRFGAFPAQPFTPNAGINFKANLLDWQSAGIQVPLEAQRAPCRVFRITLRGEKANADVRPVYDGKVPVEMRCQMNVWVESTRSRECRLPPYVIPKYPVHIEGTIYGQGPDQYQLFVDQSTSLTQYRIGIPLWGGRIVTAPFNPNLDSPQIYSPARRGTRVLVAFHFDKAFIKRYLDHAASVPLPLETQGEQLLLGPSDGNGTALRQTFQDNKPVFSIERSGGAGDSQKVQLGDGSMQLENGTRPPPGKGRT